MASFGEPDIAQDFCLQALALNARAEIYDTLAFVRWQQGRLQEMGHLLQKAQALSRHAKYLLPGRLDDYEIMLVQGRLRLSGHPHGGSDGKLDTATRRAIRSFQRAAGLQENGRIDADLLAALKG